MQLSTNAGDDAWPSGARNGRRAADAPLRDERAGALIARIGTSEPFYVGDQRSVVAPNSGRLYLGVNDDHFADNTGVFRVSIRPGGQIEGFLYFDEGFESERATFQLDLVDAQSSRLIGTAAIPLEID